MQQSLLGWILVGLGTALALRILFRRNESLGQAAGWLAVGAGAIVTGLWLTSVLDLPGTIADVFASL